MVRRARWGDEVQRNAMKSLREWKDSARRKPLLLQGARQVGKTWLACEFGRECFDDVAYVSFQDNEGMRAVFDGSLDPARLLDAVAIETGVVATRDTLVVFDEIQECPRAISSLKMFQERMPEIPIVAAGSLLGVALHEGASFPVGKVDHLDLHPLTFDEFLRATDQAMLADLLARRDASLAGAFSERLTDALRRYYFVGGMPEAVSAFAETGDYAVARAVHDRLLFDYEHDFSKHASPLLAERIRQVWASIPSQLARENKKFVYGAVRSGARARTYEEAINWLVDAGLLVRVGRVSKPGIPLASYQDANAFKLYLLDVGLLAAASRLDVSTLIKGNDLFEEFKGALTEQYVCQQLVATGEVLPWYWANDNSTAEVDFIYDHKGMVWPVEVKAETNLRAKSLRLFCERYHLDHSLRLSLAGFKDQGWVTNVPLYAANMLPKPPNVSG